MRESDSLLVPITNANVRITTLFKDPEKDLDDIINDGESIEVKCQFCNQAYQFGIDELKEIRG